jgi:cobalt-zinc-cadmium efflux system membrane fusion protein
VPTAFAVAAVSGLLAVGKHFDWKMPKFSALLGRDVAKQKDWCDEHSVPESECVECHPELFPKHEEYGWCRKHGIHECPLCNPQLVQLGKPNVTADDRRRAEETLAFAPRTSNGSKCKQHARRLQFASEEVFHKLEIATTAARLSEVDETVTTTGELDLDPTKVARLSARANGTIRSLVPPIGRWIRAGEIVAVIDAADVGKAKSELLQSLGTLELRENTVARLKESAGKTVTEQAVLDAEASRSEAEVRVIAARQALTNLGLPVDPQTLKGLSPEEAAKKIRFLGFPESLTTSLAAKIDSNNLLPVVSPFEGEVIERPGAEGEAAGPDRVIVVIADTRQMWLTLNVRLEDAARVRPGQSVRFHHEGHSSDERGQVTWVSPAADERTRTVPVRVAWPNKYGRHHAKTFGTAQIILRHVDDAVVVPRSALHWEGCCHVVFVRDKDFDTSPYKVFHVRKVRPGAPEAGLNGSHVEIAAGLLPGEVVATTNSGLLRSELLKNDLGAG